MSSNDTNNKRMNRILLLARYIQNKIDDNTPNAKEFLQFRNEIIKSNCTNLKVDLDHECDLIEKQDELKQRLDKIKESQTGGNKTEFVTLNAKIQVTEKEIKESTRLLNRLFLEHVVVQENLDKILTDVAWIKNRLEEDEIRNYIGNKGVSYTETVIELKDRTKVKEKVLLSEIHSLKGRTKRVEGNEFLRDNLKDEAERSRAELLVLKEGRCPKITKRHKERQIQIDRTQEINQSERDTIQKEISLSRKQLEREQDDHKSRMIKLNFEKEKLLNAISHFRNVETAEIEKLQKRRDILLSSKDDIDNQRLSSHNQLEVYERRRIEEEEEEMKCIQEAERNIVRQEAAFILCKRLRFLLKSNSKKKKKQSLPATPKKKGTKKKKKK